ncbi:hypothetical protein WAF17_22410 (plasmid) [Bernardetia sp. ABR2-2B]
MSSTVTISSYSKTDNPICFLQGKNNFGGTRAAENTTGAFFKKYFH